MGLLKKQFCQQIRLARLADKRRVALRKVSWGTSSEAYQTAQKDYLKHLKQAQAARAQYHNLRKQYDLAGSRRPENQTGSRSRFTRPGR